MKNLILNQDDGMKIRIYKVRPISKKGRSRLGNLKKVTHFAYVPLKPILFLSYDINTKEKIANFIYNNFGCDEDTTTYCVRYYRKLGKWRRRLKRLCMLEIDDDGGRGEMKYKFTDMSGLNKQHWYKG